MALVPSVRAQLQILKLNRRPTRRRPSSTAHAMKEVSVNDVAEQTKGADSELKAKHRSMWASGDYPSMVEPFLLPLAPRLVEACGIEPGTRVLDVAAGTGNAAIPAAAR